MSEFGLEPLAGGWSGETFLAEAAGERSVVRVYGEHSAHRGPQAPEVDAAVMAAGPWAGAGARGARGAP